MLKLKRRIDKLSSVYKNSVSILEKFDRKELNKLYLFEKSVKMKKMKQEEHFERIKKSVERKKYEKEKREKKHFLKMRKIEKEQVKNKLIEKNIEKMNNWDKSIASFDDESRRQITSKIFKAKGLKRYRQKGIPRVKKRIKYQRKLNQWKRKGYQPYKGKIPNGWAQRNINLNTTHSVQFR